MPEPRPSLALLTRVHIVNAIYATINHIVTHRLVNYTKTRSLKARAAHGRRGESEGLKCSDLRSSRAPPNSRTQTGCGRDHAALARTTWASARSLSRQVCPPDHHLAALFDELGSVAGVAEAWLRMRELLSMVSVATPSFSARMVRALERNPCAVWACRAEPARRHIDRVLAHAATPTLQARKDVPFVPSKGI